MGGRRARVFTHVERARAALAQHKLKYDQSFCVMYQAVAADGRARADGRGPSLEEIMARLSTEEIAQVNAVLTELELPQVGG